MELDDAVLYQDDPGSSAVMSERVSGLASSIYREFERLIEKYDEDVVKELMPLVVAVLENLDSVFAVNQEHEVELELLKEDNEQLVTQYEREKALRKHAEERFIALEDSQDGEKKDLQARLVTLQSVVRQMELKTKNYADQIGRFEEREAELKKEYNALHHRHTEMIHSYMEHLERSKHGAAPAEPADPASSARTRRERPLSMGLFQLPGGEGLTSDLHRDPLESPSEPWRFSSLSHPRSNTSLKDELAHFPNGRSKSGSSTNHVSRTGASESKPSSSAVPPSRTGPASSSVIADVSLESLVKPPQDPEPSEQQNLDLNRVFLEGTQTSAARREGGWGQFGSDDQESAHPPLQGDDGSEAAEPSEVQAIIESTPELDMDLEGCRGTSTPTKGGVENPAFNRNTDSLFEELSSAGNDLISDMDDGADLLGMGREVEHLIHENAQLLETKNALNVVKNDLIAQVDDLACEKEVLRGELDAVIQAKTKLEEKNKELEEELKTVRAELEDAKQKVKNENEDDSDVPTAQRKRFTRVEMARVLMERNQYKERLMELQEAVRWTEMIRASKENPALPEKKKSSLWQFFSRLFSSSGGGGKKPAAAAEAPVNVKYNAPTSHIQPSIKKKSSTLQQLPSDKSKAFDFLNEEAPAESVVTRREQKRAQYQQVKAHVQKEDGRVQAYGWSLPKKLKGNGAQAEKMKNLPVPVFLRPLDEKEASMKLWCAAGVNLSEGKTRDGGLLVGASVFYHDLSGSEGPQKKAGSQSSLEKLDQELQEQQKELQHHDRLSSLVWICTSTQSASKVVVIDANQPGNILESFVVCNAHVLCITSVPGARETDYPAEEEGAPNPEAGPAGDGSSASADSSSPSGDSILGGITVVGCEAEGAGAGPGENLCVDSRAAQEPAGESLRSVHADTSFSDPLGAGEGSLEREGEPPRDGAESNPEQEEQLTMEEAQRMSSVQPTMWLGAQDGHLYVHSSVAHWRRRLHSIKLKESVFCIVHVKGRVLVSMSDGTIAIFRRGADGQWDLGRYHLLDLGRPAHSIRCMTVVHDAVWCGYRNKIYVVKPKAMRVEKSFDAHPRQDSQVRQLAWHGDGIWVSIRLDSTLRLFHARTYQHLQDVDIEPYVSKMLGTGKLGFSFVRITALMMSCNRLWIGTGNGVIISIPLTETSKASKAAGNLPGAVVRLYGDDSGDRVTAGTVIPYCSMAQAQLCFHGHRDAVKFFAAVPGEPSAGTFPRRRTSAVSAVAPTLMLCSVPGHAVPPSSSGGEAAGEKSDASCQEGMKSVLVMSGGEGYIDFRIGDEDGEAQEADAALLKLQASPAKAERSHLIVWQVLLSGE
ncbi:C-Jun-amino-terminal kinase-interacting protein 4 isoform X4 [Oryzias latipes]